MRPYDDHDIIETLIVDHGKKKNFEKAFDDALKIIKKNNPEEWQVNDALARLEKQGWQILRPEQMIIEY